jgi:hypothetical protein
MVISSGVSNFVRKDEFLEARQESPTVISSREFIFTPLFVYTYVKRACSLQIRLPLAMSTTTGSKELNVSQWPLRVVDDSNSETKGQIIVVLAMVVSNDEFGIHLFILL